MTQVLRFLTVAEVDDALQQVIAATYSLGGA
jgi:hypothetical protein